MLSSRTLTTTPTAPRRPRVSLLELLHSLCVVAAYSGCDYEVAIQDDCGHSYAIGDAELDEDQHAILLLIRTVQKDVGD